VSNFHGQRKFVEQLKKVGQVVDIEGVLGKRPRELDENGRKSIMGLKRLDTSLEIVHIHMRKSLPFMGKNLMKFDSEHKIWEALHPFYP